MEQQLLQTYYTNPLISDDFPDPSVIEVKDQGYFAYATHDEYSPTINNILVIGNNVIVFKTLLKWNY